MLCKKHYKIFNRFVILELLSLCELPTSYYCSKNLLYSLLKTQRFAILLSVTVSKTKNFSSPF